MSTFNSNEVMEELDWDSEISRDFEFVLLPEGEYNFKVVKFERAIHNGSEKLPRCNKAVLTLEITSDDASQKTKIEHNLFVHRKCEGMLCEFFAAIGHRKHGEAMKMNWAAVPGSTGRCKVYVDNWKNKNGEPMQSNKIKKFLEPKQQPISSGFTPGRF